MDDGASSDECPRYSEKETWENEVQCRNTVSIRVELILELHRDLKKVQVAGAIDEELRKLTEETRNFLIEDLKDFETNQHAIGMKHLFLNSQLKRGKEHMLEATNTQLTIE